MHRTIQDLGLLVLTYGKITLNNMSKIVLWKYLNIDLECNTRLYNNDYYIIITIVKFDNSSAPSLFLLFPIRDT